MSQRPSLSRLLPGGGRPRLVRVTLALAAVACVAGLAAQRFDPQETAPISTTESGKLADRLSFVEGDPDVPVRATRIYDTLAMFALPQSDGRTWSERPAILAPAAAHTRLPADRAAERVPRMVRAEAAAIAPRHPVLPPNRPAGTGAAKPEVLAALPPPAQVVAMASNRTGSADREPIRLLGWDVPGSRHVPRPRDATRLAGAVGDGAVAVGTGTARAIGNTATAVGDTVSSFGKRVAETVGWR